MFQVSVPQQPYDAIMVGSGTTGGWAAEKRTEGGMRVVAVEAGSKITPDPKKIA